MKAKFKLTDEYKINPFGVKLFRIEATVDIEARGVKKGDKGGFVKKESNLSGDAWVFGNAEVYGDARVYGNAWVSGDAEVYGNAEVSGDARVYGDARVSGDARVYGDKNYTRGWFIGGDDTGKITNITDQMGTDYWKAQYVLGDYEITDKEPPKEKTNPQEIQIKGATYVLKEDN